MNKKLLIFGLFVFIAFMAISYVSAGQSIFIDEEETGDSHLATDEILISDSENKVLKGGKSIQKTVKVEDYKLTYGKEKTKKLVSREGFKKSFVKKQIKKAVKGKSVFYDLNKQLKNAKISKITFKNYKFKDHGYKYTGLKVIIKYKPLVLKTVTKTTKATIQNYYNDPDYVSLKYINPFTHKKEIEYGEFCYW